MKNQLKNNLVTPSLGDCVGRSWRGSETTEAIFFRLPRYARNDFVGFATLPMVARNDTIS